MGNNCHCKSHERSREADLSGTGESTLSEPNAGAINPGEELKLNVADLELSGSVSSIKDDPDYQKLVFELDRGPDANPPELDEDSKWVLGALVREPLPVSQLQPLETFLIERKKHDFLSPHNSPFITKLAQVDFMVTHATHAAPHDLARVAADFVAGKSSSSRAAGGGLQNTISFRKTSLKMAPTSRATPKRVTLISKPEIASFDINEGGLREVHRPCALQPVEDGAPWPCEPIIPALIVGPVRFPSGEIYMGEIRKGQREGYGVQVWPDGSIYEGYWKEGKLHKLGLMVFCDGDVYEGEWRDGKMSGTGIFRSPGNFEFRGSFKNNEPEGRGEEHWDQGILLKGTWVSGHRKGLFEILGPGWTLVGPISLNDSTRPLQLTRDGYIFNVSMVDGKLEGSFECSLASGDDNFALTGQLVAGKADGPASAFLTDREYLLHYSDGKLISAVKVPKTPQLLDSVPKGRSLPSSQVTPADKGFLVEAVTLLEGINVPFF